MANPGLILAGPHHGPHHLISGTGLQHLAGETGAAATKNPAGSSLSEGKGHDELVDVAAWISLPRCFIFIF